MKSPPIQLGVFDLVRVIGEGGMGQVWLGVHREQQVEVAIKVLRGEKASQVHIRQAFLREVQSVARLLHSGIIRIFDYGDVSEEASEASGGQLCARAPYIAMELATRGSLNELNGVLSWRQLRWMLIETLNALAHAHARELIHRDLKPDNILLTAGEDRQTCLKLTDFGIVHITDPDVSTSTQDMSALYAGTPAYMSPEQLRGKWRDFGPWTDLYALGCVAYEQCSGRLPFQGENLFDIAHQQLTESVPPLESRVPIPEGFNDWVMRLLEKNPRDRFQRAADAAWALMQLPDPEGAEGPDQPPVQLGGMERHVTSDPDAPTLDQITLVLEPEPQHTTQNTLHTDLLSQLNLASRAPSDLGEDAPQELFIYKDAPPLPANWQRKRAPTPSIQLMGAGLGLYGLREIPFVAREQERTALWQAMTMAFREGVPRAVIVRGSTGIGKSRLIHWIAERAHEVGAATILKATHSPEAPPTLGIARMIARELGAIGLERKKTFARLKQILSTSTTHHNTAELDALALTELFLPGEADEPLVEDGPRAQINTPRDRYIVVARVLEFLCQERPVFITLDDAHWSVETLEAVRLLLTEPQTRNLPIFIALSINDDVQTIRPTSRRMLEALSAMGQVTDLALTPLEADAQRLLLDALLMLEDRLSDEILDLAHGNPMFAVQLVGEWIQRDILEPGADGYQLREGAAPFLPDTLDQLWSTRLAQLVRTVQQRSPRFTEGEIRTALELAAALGQQVSFQEWGNACAKHDLVVPGALVDAMITQGFATAERKSWSFAHDQLRNMLVRSAREEGHWEAINQSCAAMIDALYTRDDQGAPERLVTHLIEARAVAHAIEPLFYLIGVYHLRNEYERAEHYLDQLEEILYELELPNDDVRHGRFKLMRCAHLLQTSGVRPAYTLLMRLLEDAERHRWWSLLGDVYILEGKLHLFRGEINEAIARSDAASEHFAEIGQQLGLASCFLLSGQIHAVLNLHAEAKRYVRTAIDLCKDIPRDEHPHAIDNLLGSAYSILGFAYQRAERYDKATLAMKRAIRHFKEIGNRHGANLTHSNLGDLARLHDNFDAAERFYLDAEAFLQEIPHGAAALPRLNYGLALIEQERWEEALERVESALGLLEAIGYELYLPTAHVAAACCHAALDSSGWRPHLAQGTRRLADSLLIDPDLAMTLEHCADQLCHDHPEQALDLYEFARHQHERCGTDEAHMRKLRHRTNLTVDRLPREVRLARRRARQQRARDSGAVP